MICHPCPPPHQLGKWNSNLLYTHHHNTLLPSSLRCMAQSKSNTDSESNKSGEFAVHMIWKMYNIVVKDFTLVLIQCHNFMPENCFQLLKDLDKGILECVCTIIHNRPWPVLYVIICTMMKPHFKGKTASTNHIMHSRSVMYPIMVYYLVIGALAIISPAHSLYCITDFAIIMHVDLKICFYDIS
jgi:hypothetical protein